MSIRPCNSWTREHTQAPEFPNTSCQSLLSILHDKNRIIEKLQRQLHFQKLQLKYYLGRSLNSSKIKELSDTACSNVCLPHVIEENLPVTLALSRFKNQMGIKSKIVSLHDRMSTLDGRMHTVMQIQEGILRNIVSRLCQLSSHGDSVEVQVHLQTLTSSPEYMELFNSLLNANISLRKKLDTFRICCDRLMVLEEERNMIVEQVYSMPIEQRTNCNYLIGIQIEKIQLQNKVKDILKDQDLLRNRIDELSVTEEQLKVLQEQYKTAFKINNENVSKMLKDVNHEAVNIMTKSKEQKEKYMTEIEKLKKENTKISKVLKYVKSTIQEKGYDSENLNLNTVYSAGLYRMLDTEIEQVVQHSEIRRKQEINTLKSDCNTFQEQLMLVLEENKILKQKLSNSKLEINTVREEFAKERQALEGERDTFKAQVQDLQAIRSAYAQLCPENKNGKIVNPESIIKQRTKKIEELKAEKKQLSEEICCLRDVLGDRESLIEKLQNVIELSKSTVQRTLDKDFDFTRDFITTKPEKHIQDMFISPSTHESSEENPASSHVLSDDLESYSEIKTNPINPSTEVVPGTSSIDIKTNTSENSKISTAKSLEKQNQTERLKNIVDMSNQGQQATTFEIESSHRDGKRDYFKGILEGRDKIEGTIKMGDNSKLSVKVNNCKETSSKKTDSKIVLDEYELMRDCSVEALSFIIPSVGQRTDNVFASICLPPQESHKVPNRRPGVFTDTAGFYSIARTGHYQTSQVIAPVVTNMNLLGESNNIHKNTEISDKVKQLFDFK